MYLNLLCFNQYLLKCIKVIEIIHPLDNTILLAKHNQSHDHLNTEHYYVLHSYEFRFWAANIQILTVNKLSIKWSLLSLPVEAEQFELEPDVVAAAEFLLTHYCCHWNLGPSNEPWTRDAMIGRKPLAQLARTHMS